MKNLLTATLLLFFGNFVFSQTPVKVSGQFLHSPVDSVYISKFTGKGYTNIKGTKLAKDGKFSIQTTIPSPDYYVIRLGNVHTNIILQDSSDIKVYGDAKKLKEFCNFVGSDASQAMNGFAVRLEKWNMKSDSAFKAMTTTDTVQKRKINEYMTKEYYSYLNDRQQFVADNPNSPALIVALVSFNAETEFDSFETILNQLVIGFPKSQTVKDYVNYSNSLKLKKEEEKKKAEVVNQFAPGKKAPEFEELTSDRKTTLKLADLKGKYVLIDFWASWCGPCRKENPNVVKTYEKYKDKGFTVLSVSLDSDKDKWLGAIQADKLSWPNHVSDLGGWNSKVPRMYNVSSIPFTVLLDKEGNIIQTNLRGEALEEKLAEIFGQ